MTNKTFKPNQIPGLEKAADAASVFEYYVPNTTFDSETGQYFAYGGGDYAEGVDPEKRQAYIDKAMQDPTKWVANNLNWSGLGDRGDFSALDDQIKFLKDNNYDTKTLYQPGLTQYNLTKQIIGQGTTGRWSGEGFGGPVENAKHMASTLMGAGIEDIKDFGSFKKQQYANYQVQPEMRAGSGEEISTPTGRYFFEDEYGGRTYVDAKDVTPQQYYDGESGGYYNQYFANVPIGEQTIYGNKKTQQAINPNYDQASGNIFSGTYAGHGRTNFGVQFAADGTPYFYTQFGGDTSSMSDIAPILTALSIVPSPLQPFAAAANALIAIDSGNTLAGLAALAGIPGVAEAANAAGLASIASGIQTANKVAGLVNAIESGNVAGLVSSAASMSGAGGELGSTAIGDTGLTVSDAMKASNLVQAIASGDQNAMFKAATSFANSPTVNKALDQPNTPITASGEKVADVVGDNFVAQITNPDSPNFLGNAEKNLTNIFNQTGTQLASTDNTAAMQAIDQSNKPADQKEPGVTVIPGENGTQLVIDENGQVVDMIPEGTDPAAVLNQLNDTNVEKTEPTSVLNQTDPTRQTVDKTKPTQEIVGEPEQKPSDELLRIRDIVNQAGGNVAIDANGLLVDAPKTDDTTPEDKTTVNTNTDGTNNFPPQWQVDEEGNHTIVNDDGSTLTINPDGEIIHHTEATDGGTTEVEPAKAPAPAPSPTPAPAPSASPSPAPAASKNTGPDIDWGQLLKNAAGIGAITAGGAAIGNALTGDNQPAPAPAPRTQLKMDWNQAQIQAPQNGIAYGQQYFNPTFTEVPAAQGGLMSLAGGGMLGSYSDGGRLLRGPGDGMSDNIPASIAGKQPARLADGEFVIPADVVSHLGNGSTEAGSKVLYDMMERIRKARTGNPKQGKQINPSKFMPK